MPGDEVQEEAAAVAKAVAEAGRARIGPRHAAPRKPFLTRLHMPAGKAIAMAAMPSAVLMGMGLTPQLASAKPVPKSPFKDGPCVSAPDKEEEAEKEAAEKAAEEKAAKEAAAKKKAAEEKAAKEKAAEEKAAEEKAAQEKAEAEKEDSGSTDSSGSTDTGSEEPEPSPSESDAGSDADAEKNPLDPLGLGDAIEDLLTPEEKKAAEEEKAAEEKAAEEKAAAEESAESGKDSLTKPVEDTVDKVEKGLEDTTDALEKDVEGAKDGLEKTTPSGTDEEKEEAAGTDENGKKAFPCVEEKKVDGENEQTPVVLPNQPWELQASSLALHGLDYKGVVNVKTANGSTKQVLKFTAKSVDIGDLHQIVDGPGGTKYHVEAAKGSNSTIRDGQVTMYTERLEGNLFGLIPIVFDPEHPPPLNIPEAYFTNVKVKQAGQFGGTLTIPGLQQSITQ